MTQQVKRTRCDRVMAGALPVYLPARPRLQEDTIMLCFRFDKPYKCPICTTNLIEDKEFHETSHGDTHWVCPQQHYFFDAMFDGTVYKEAIEFNEERASFDPMTKGDHHDKCKKDFDRLLNLARKNFDQFSIN